MFKKVEPKQSFPKMEEEILKFWEDNKIFEKSVEKNPDSKPFVFYEGPPTANGTPGLHHVLARAFKDVIPRYKTMKGFRVERKAGWDTHGLPVELQVEKQLGLKNKQDIENIIPGNVRESIIEFNKKCKESVWVYRDLWEKLTRRMAYWVDMKNPYVTYENKYIESVWWVISEIFKIKNIKGESMMYKGHKVVPYCYRCGTALSSHEVAQGYQIIKDNSITIKFKLLNETDAYVLAWTTTPWTLPGNVALAVGPEIEYVFVEKKDAESGKIVQFVLAEDRLRNIFGDGGYRVIKALKGKDLVGFKYEPLYKISDKENAYKIIAGNFVSTEDGTGVVHIAPAFGEDDANVGKENDLPTIITVNEKGEMDADVPGKGIPVKKKNEKNQYAVDELIIEDLKKRELFFSEGEYEHDYPFCWRCGTPLIYYAKPSWFIRMSELSADMVKSNSENIFWIPEHIKEGRFGEWLRGVKDWAISRERYWGTPLPVWTCDKCENVKVISSQDEIEKLSGMKIEDLHKPFIDDVKFKCECGGEMKREAEVLDVWFDSGSMPTAQFHYPNSATKEDKEKIESGKYYPADFISEAVDQTRGWFYTLHAISILLNKAGKVPTGFSFRNVICLGHILDAKGKKMSKSLGNIVDPMAIMNEYGADMLRWMLFTINQPGLPKRFDVKVIKEIMNRVFRMLWNSYYFFVMYANIDGFNTKANKKLETNNLLDKWILSELNMLVKNVDEKLENYDIYSATGMIEKFVDNLSNWYIRRSRKRFWKSENDSDKNGAYATLHYVLVELSKLMAPFTPFVAEEIYKNLTGEESVHLAEFPKANGKLIDEKLNEEMNRVRNIVSEGLQKRAEAKIKVRQPLGVVSIKYKVLSKELLNIIKEELNIKDVKLDDGMEENVKLDTEITEELKLEGIAREIIRFIQEMRKEAGYEVENRIEISHQGYEKVFEKFGDLIAKEVLANSIGKEALKDFDLEKEVKIEGDKIVISIKRA